MKFSALLLSLTLSLFGAVEGVVTNATTGSPQPGAMVTLIDLGKGMQTVATVKAGADGKFQMDATLDASGQYLLQGLFEGVTYNRMLPPGSPSTGLDLQVFNTVAKPGDAKVTQHMILLEPSAAAVAVSETMIYSNSGKTTFSSPDGTLRFFIPSAVTSPVRIMVQGPQGMPVQRQAEKGKEPNTWVVKAPIKPGETRIDLSYTMPAKSPATFSSKVLHGGGPVRIVVPKGVSLEGSAVTNGGTHPQTQATIYDVAGSQYSVNVKGIGSLRAAADAPSQESGGGPAASGEDAGPGIEAVKPLIYRRLPWILALGLGMLGVGFVSLYRAGAPVRLPPVAKAPKGR